MLIARGKRYNVMDAGSATMTHNRSADHVLGCVENVSAASRNLITSRFPAQHNTHISFLRPSYTLRPVGVPVPFSPISSSRVTDAINLFLALNDTCFYTPHVFCWFYIPSRLPHRRHGP